LLKQTFDILSIILAFNNAKKEKSYEDVKIGRH